MLLPARSQLGGPDLGGDDDVRVRLGGRLLLPRQGLDCPRPPSTLAIRLQSKVKNLGFKVGGVNSSVIFNSFIVRKTSKRA